MSNAQQEYHLLHVKTAKGEQTYYLNAATVSIGRDSANAVKVHDPLVSRQHALLLRMPSKNNQYEYQIVDGDVNGRPSRNGVLINQEARSRKMLVTGDRIQIGKTTMSYMIARMTAAEYSQFFNAQTIQFHSLKEEVLNPTGTLLSTDERRVA